MNEFFSEHKNYIDTVCARGSIETKEGLQRCRQVCEKSLFEVCCQTPSGSNDLSSACKVNSKAHSLAGCAAYAKCQVILETSIDPAPGTLPVFCRDDERKESCQDVCEVAKCCYSTGGGEIESCRETNWPQCLDYVPCQNLRSTVGIKAAPNDLDIFCANGLEECQEICASAAECCNEEACFQQNTLSCLSYSVCLLSTNVSFFGLPSILPESPTDSPTKGANDVTGGADTLGIGSAVSFVFVLFLLLS